MHIQRTVTAALIAIFITFSWVIFIRNIALASAPPVWSQETTATICVRPGGSPPTCYPTIQQGINAASPGDVISVAVGTYPEYITITKPLQLIGHGWTNTIIDPGHAKAHSVVHFQGIITSSTLISGFQITGGGTAISSTSTQDGGGMYLYGHSPTIQNTWLNSNNAYKGGGIKVIFGSPILINVPMWSNVAYMDGGGLSARGANITLLGDPSEPFNGTIYGNTADLDGGGIAVVSSTLTMAGIQIAFNQSQNGGGLNIERCGPNLISLFLNDISFNTAESSGAGLNIDDGQNLSILLNNVSNNSTTGTGSGGAGFKIVSSGGLIQNNTVSGNIAGGTARAGGGFLIWLDTDNLQIIGNTIQNNTAGEGAGIEVTLGGAPKIDSNVILTNTASMGAGIYIRSGESFSVTNNIIARNIVPGSGSGSAGGVAILDTPVHLVNNTIANNSREGVFFSGAEGAIILNNIIYSNETEGLENNVGDPTINYLADYNDVFGNAYNYWNMPAGSNDRNVNPFFVASGPTLFDYYHIQLSSIVSDTGTMSYAPLYDIDNQVRGVGPNSMGADKPGTIHSIYLPLIVKP